VIASLPLTTITVTDSRIYALELMSRTAQAVKNAAAALKKACNKEGRETADRIISAAITLVIFH